MTQDQPGNNSKKQSFNWYGLLIWISLALLLRWQVIEPRWIPSGSMLPTLQIQDRILIEKITPKIAALQHKDLHRGSVVVFYPPERLVNAGYEQKTALIKRIIGVPGDVIEVVDGSLLRNGQIIQENWRRKPMAYEQAPIKVGKDQLWVLGDNRDYSLDSHIWGPLPAKNVVGKAIWRYWPLKKFGPIRFPVPKELET